MSAKYYPTIAAMIKSKLIAFLDKAVLSEEEFEREIAEILLEKSFYHLDSKLNSSQKIYACKLFKSHSFSIKLTSFKLSLHLFSHQIYITT